MVELPIELWWSGARMLLDLDEVEDRQRCYELVLAEGSTDDVREYVDYEELVRLWRDLTLPTYVRKAWEQWFEQRGVIFAEC